MTPSARTLSWLLSAAALAGLAGCESGANVWVASEMRTITERSDRIDDELVFDASGKTIKLFAGANETVSFQVIVDAGAQPLENLRVKWSALAAETGATIDAARIRTFRMWPIHIDRFPPWYIRLTDAAPAPMSFYDALTPVEMPGIGQPFSLPAEGRLALWVDVRIPRDARPGTYHGTGNIHTWSILDEWLKLEVEVYDFVLPDTRPIATIGGFDHAELFKAFLARDGRPYAPPRLDRTNPLVRRGLVLMRQLMQLAHQHRLDLFDRRIRPQLKRDGAGRVRLEWTDYDAIVSPYLDGSAFEDRIGCAAWPLPFSDTWPQPNHYGGPNAPRYRKTAAEVIAQAGRHFVDVLKAPDQGFCWPSRQPVSAAAYGRHVRLARIAKSADPKTPVLSLLPPNPPAATGWTVPPEFAKLTDVFAPPGHWLDPKLAAAAATPNHPLAGVWLSPGEPPYLPSLGVLATPADVRALPWFALKYPCTGLFLPEVLNWPVSSLSVAAGAETRLFYPAGVGQTQIIIPSARLKRLRRGLQDLAYLWVLRQRQRGAIARTMLDTMTRYAGLEAAGDNYLDPRLGGWVQDPGLWQMARRLLAEEVNDAVHPGARSRDRLLAQRVAWKRFGDRAYRVETERVRTRVEPIGTDGTLRATVMLDLYNQYRRDVEVVVKFDALPAGWRALAGEVKLAPMPAAGRRVVALTARGPYRPAGRNAKMTLPVSIALDNGQRRAHVASVPLLRAPHVTQAPRIDGDLTDWPLRAGNTAGDFRLVGRRGAVGTGLAGRQTLAFVVRDATCLYIAIRCAEPLPDQMVARTSNIFRYKQLLACEEDLVEVILDPGQTARTTGQLYHIAIKPTGAMITERGVRTDPPLGQTAPWPVRARVAVSRQKDFWAVELAIPLSAFGPAGQKPFWGVNFARFATQGAEASSWAEAARYFYDPRSLGTMILQPTK